LLRSALARLTKKQKIFHIAYNQEPCLSQRSSFTGGCAPTNFNSIIVTDG
jgi:hypothetical protein